MDGWPSGIPETPQRCASAAGLPASAQPGTVQRPGASPCRRHRRPATNFVSGRTRDPRGHWSPSAPSVTSSLPWSSCATARGRKLASGPARVPTWPSGAHSTPELHRPELGAAQSRVRSAARRGGHGCACGDGRAQAGTSATQGAAVRCRSAARRPCRGVAATATALDQRLSLFVPPPGPVAEMRPVQQHPKPSVPRTSQPVPPKGSSRQESRGRTHFASPAVSVLCRRDCPRGGDGE